MTKISLILFAALAIASGVNSEYVPCTNTKAGLVFGFTTLDGKNVQFSNKDKPLGNVDINDKPAFNAYLTYNICKNTDKTPLALCAGATPATAYILYASSEGKEVDSCFALTPTEDITKKTAATWTWDFTAATDSNPKSAFYTMSATPGSASTDKNKFNIKMTCDPDITVVTNDMISVKFDQASKTYSIEFATAEACGTDPIAFMKKFKLIFIPAFIVFGLLIAFFGNKMFKYTLMVTGFLTG